MRLRADGLVLSRQGKGTFVVSRPVERMVSFATTEDVARFLGCLEVRLPLEITSAKLAAERRTPEQMDRIERTGMAFQAEMEAAGATPKSDLAFHLAVAEATGNGFFSRVLGGLGNELSGFMRLSLNLTRTGSKERARQVLEEHTRIIEAIRNQDSEGAAFAMQFHISEARRRLINRNREPQARAQ
jgi:GntR family transcriptional repressor for pyruvate dehydrogenase complex